MQFKLSFQAASVDNCVCNSSFQAASVDRRMDGNWFLSQLGIAEQVHDGWESANAKFKYKSIFLSDILKR